MNRREEYWVLTEQLRREPPELESAVRRGMDRARRRRRRPAELLAGLAGVCAAFVVMVNASPGRHPHLPHSAGRYDPAHGRGEALRANEARLLLKH